MFGSTTGVADRQHVHPSLFQVASDGHGGGTLAAKAGIVVNDDRRDPGSGNHSQHPLEFVTALLVSERASSLSELCHDLIPLPLRELPDLSELLGNREAALLLFPVETRAQANAFLMAASPPEDRSGTTGPMSA